MCININAECDDVNGFMCMYVKREMTTRNKCLSVTNRLYLYQARYRRKNLTNGQ